MKKQSILAARIGLACSILFFPAMTPAQSPQAPAKQEPQVSLAKPQAEYNVSFCNPATLGAAHFYVSADKKVLDIDYYRNGNAVEKDEATDGSHLIFKLDMYEETENHFVKIHGVDMVADSDPTAPAHKVEFAAQSFGNRVAGIVQVDGHVRYAIYGYSGPVDDLVKLDASAESETCGELVMGGVEGLPDNLVNWLKFGKLSAPDKSDKS